MYKALIIGAGRIGAGFNWHDDAYTHAGAYRALKDRVELVGFVELDPERAAAASEKWGVENWVDIRGAVAAVKPDVISICTQPENRASEVVQCLHDGLSGLWIEKPLGFTCHEGFSEATDFSRLPPLQVNYMRRGDILHQKIAREDPGGLLVVHGKPDIHTRCHFEDLAKWWKAKLDYHPVSGPCSYVYHGVAGTHTFDNGGVDGGECFEAMCQNLLDHMDDPSIPLWSPP